MAYTGPINSPATVGNPSAARAVRNPSVVDGVTYSGSSPGKRDLSITRGAMGNPMMIALQRLLMNRADPRQSMSLTEEELRKSALSRLKGQ